MTTREQWLAKAVRHLRKRFSAAGCELPEAIRVSCGWPHANGTRRKRMVIGECWRPEVSGDGHWEIFVSPKLDCRLKVLDTLVHELCHTAMPAGEGHKRRFRKLAEAVGLTGKMTATYPTHELRQALDVLGHNTLGHYPHAEIKGTSDHAGRKQGTRMVKITCEKCGYVARTSRKWIEIGLPTCTACGCMFVAEDDFDGDGE